MAGNELGTDYDRFPAVPEDTVGSQTPKAPDKGSEPKLPIFSILDSIDFSKHFLIVGDVGTGKSTVTPIHEFELSGGLRQLVIREPSRAACNALHYSLQSLYPRLDDELAVITKDTQINVHGKIKIVTDGVLLRMLAEDSVLDSSIYFDESHQMSSQLELCMSLAKKEEEDNARNLFRVMSATIDPREFLSFLGISNIYRISGRRYPVKLEEQLAGDLNGMFRILDRYLYSQPRDESWLVFLPTRKLVEKYADNYRGVYIHGGLEGSEINKIQRRAETDKNLRIFATNVIASSVNIYVDNVLIFDDVIDSKDKLGQKTLHYSSIDNNSLLQMMGRVGRFKPGRAVILTDERLPKNINPVPVRKALETETPFDLVLLMSKYGLKLSELEFMSRVDHREVAFAENWLVEIGAIGRNHKTSWKGLLMSEIPYEPDFAHMISTALFKGDYDTARFFLASGSFGDSLNHAYKSDMERPARKFIYGFDKSNELNIKAHLLKGYAEDTNSSFVAKMVANGLYPGYVEEAWKNYEAAREALNDLLESSKKPPIPRDVVVDENVARLRPYLENCMSFERFGPHEKKGHEFKEMSIVGPFYARSLTINYRRILFDIVAMNSPTGHHHRTRR